MSSGEADELEDDERRDSVEDTACGSKGVLEDLSDWLAEIRFQDAIVRVQVAHAEAEDDGEYPAHDISVRGVSFVPFRAYPRSSTYVNAMADDIAHGALISGSEILDYKVSISQATISRNEHQYSLFSDMSSSIIISHRP